VRDVSPQVLERAGKVRLILLDVDGVLTDGRIHVISAGEDARAFDSKDGLGIRLATEAQLTFAIISGRRSTVVERRATELRITEIHQRILDKATCTREILERLELKAEEACYVGDDLIDVPAMRAVGFAVAPSDATPEARDAAHYVTERAGGRGAVRELVDLVLRANGKWDDVTRRFLK